MPLRSVKECPECLKIESQQREREKVDLKRELRKRIKKESSLMRFKVAEFYKEILSEFERQEIVIEEYRKILIAFYDFVSVFEHLWHQKNDFVEIKKKRKK